MKMFRKSERGFTLVELLIVVAIIGVLSTIGIPTFRRMMQKSRQAEARVNLGNLFTVEQAFFSEYGAFGNNLLTMGYEVSGDQANISYVVGFMDVAAADLTTRYPAQADNFGLRVDQQLPAYYAATAPTGQSLFRAGRLTMTQAPIVGAYSAYDVGTYADQGTANPLDDVLTAGTAPYSGFVATAAGVVAPGLDRDGNNVAAALIDVWTMNQNRQLVNAQYGVQ